MKNKIIIITIIVAIATTMANIPINTACADIPEALDLSCDAAVLIDARTGEVVFSYNEDVEMPVASVNKIMTLYLVFLQIENGRISLEDTVNASHNAASMGGSQVYLEEGGQYQLHELIKSIIVASANDSCVAVAEHIAGSEQGFVQMMNETASDLGLTNTLYENCSGLPADNHYMSALDIAKLSVELMKYDLFFSYSTIWTETFIHPSGRTTLMTNTNKLTRNYVGCDGIKTGFTNEAMYCLSATAKKADTRLIAVVLGEPTSSIRNNDIAEMLNYGFANYTTYMVYKKGDIVQQDVHIYGAKNYEKCAVANEDICLFVGKEDRGTVTTTIKLNEAQVAPLAKGDPIGEVEIFLDGEYAKSYELVVNRDVEAMNYFDCLKQVIDIYCSGF